MVVNREIVMSLSDPKDLMIPLLPPQTQKESDSVLSSSSSYVPPSYVGSPDANGIIYYNVLGKTCQVDMTFENGTNFENSNRIQLNSNNLGATITIVEPFLEAALAIIPKNIDLVNCSTLYYQKTFFLKLINQTAQDIDMTIVQYNGLKYLTTTLCKNSILSLNNLFRLDENRENAGYTIVQANNQNPPICNYQYTIYDNSQLTGYDLIETTSLITINPSLK